VRHGRRHARVFEFTRESLAIEVGRSFRSEQVCSVLDELIGQRGGVPTALRMDNGPEFVALSLRGLSWAVSPPWNRRRLHCYIDRASRGRTGWRRVSMRGCATSFWTRKRSYRFWRRRCVWVCGEDTTTRSVCIRAWTTEHRRSWRSGGPGKSVKIGRRLSTLLT
jgi:hypothetical protein